LAHNQLFIIPKAINGNDSLWSNAQWKEQRIIIGDWANMSSTLELKENTTVVVLGASGDLAKKKTVGLRLSGSQMQITDDSIVPGALWPGQ
jgi:hypothetical protein